MKKSLKLIALSLIIAFALNLVACSTYSKVQKALEDIGYAVVETSEQGDEVKEEAENDERVINAHILSNKDSLTGLENIYLTTVIVLEFKATEDLVEYLKEDSVAQGFIDEVREDGTVEEIYNELKENGFANGNCLIIPIGLGADAVTDAIKGLNA